LILPVQPEDDTVRGVVLLSREQRQYDVIDLLTDVLMATSKSRHDFWTFTFTGVSNDHM
jgi:hypothetical protein